jgi:DNA-binding NarL/FixJ family response regulator
MIRVVVVDDQALVREGLGLVLGAQPDLDVVAELPDGPALHDFLDTGTADVILLDLYLPGADGVQVLGRLPAHAPPVLMLTTVGRAADVQRALAAGAAGFVLKDAGGAELAAAVRSAHAGVTALSSSAARLLWPRNHDPEPPGVRLTAREQQVLALVGRGLSNQEIARSLSVAERTVKAHVSNLLAKLAVTSRTQAALLARDRA